MSEIAGRCICGGCDAACWMRPFKPCCGACGDGTPHEQAEIVWPLNPPTDDTKEQQ